MLTQADIAKLSFKEARVAIAPLVLKYHSLLSQVGFDFTKPNGRGYLDLKRSDAKPHLAWWSEFSIGTPVGAVVAKKKRDGTSFYAKNDPYSLSKLARHLLSRTHTIARRKANPYDEDWMTDNPEERACIDKHLMLFAGYLSGGITCIDCDNHDRSFPHLAWASSQDTLRAIWENFGLQPLVTERNPQTGGVHAFYNAPATAFDTNLLERVADERIGIDIISNSQLIRLPFSHTYEPFIYEPETGNIEFFPDAFAFLQQWEPIIAPPQPQLLLPDIATPTPEEPYAKRLQVFARQSGGELADRYAYPAGKRVVMLKRLAKAAVASGLTEAEFKVQALKANRGSRDYAIWSPEQINKDLQSFYQSALKGPNNARSGESKPRKQQEKVFVSHRAKVPAEISHRLSQLARWVAQMPGIEECLPKRLKQPNRTALVENLLIELIGLYYRSKEVPSQLVPGVSVSKRLRQELITGFRVHQSWLERFAKAYNTSPKPIKRLYTFLIARSDVISVLPFADGAQYKFRYVACPRRTNVDEAWIDSLPRKARMARRRAERVLQVVDSTDLYTNYMYYVSRFPTEKRYLGPQISMVQGLGRAPPAWQTG